MGAKTRKGLVLCKNPSCGNVFKQIFTGRKEFCCPKCKEGFYKRNSPHPFADKDCEFTFHYKNSPVNCGKPATSMFHGKYYCSPHYKIIKHGLATDLKTIIHKLN